MVSRLITSYWRLKFASLSYSRRHSANADIIADAKSKIIVSRLQFFADEIFSNPSKVQNYQNKTGKTPIPKQILAYYVFQGILKIFSNIYALFFIFSKL